MNYITVYVGIDIHKPKPGGKKKVRIDKCDAALIARCLRHRDYSPMHIPTEQDEQVKEYSISRCARTISLP